MKSTMEVERALLGAMLLNPDAVDVATDIVRDSAKFATDAHRAIYEAIVAISGAGKAVDLLLLSERLRAAGALETAGGVAYFAELMEAVPTSHNAPHYAERLNELFTARQLANAAARFVAQEGRGAVDGAALEDYAREIEAAYDGHDPGGAVPVSVAFRDVLTSIEARRRAGHAISGVRTGIEPLDVLMLGLRPGTLNILAARPSVGKSAIAANFALAAARAGTPVLFFSLEMSAEAVTRRLLTIMSGVPYRHYCDGFNVEERNAQLSEVARELSALPFEVDASPGLTPAQFRARSRRFARRHGAPLIVLDYLQLLSGDTRRNRYEILGEITRAAKCLAGDIAAPVLMLSQLARDADALDDPFRALPMLRESGNTEQDADTVMIALRAIPAWLEEMGEAEGLDVDALLNFGLVKNRDGAVGLCPLHFDKDTQGIAAL